jgi:hypothetical protein
MSRFIAVDFTNCLYTSSCISVKRQQTTCITCVTYS